MADIIFWKANDFHITLYSKVFEVADYEFVIGFSEIKMADPIWWTSNFENRCRTEERSYERIVNALEIAFTG